MIPALPRDAVAARQVYLMPGAMHCAGQPTMITTILGSCIALCLWDRMRRIGGMNHYVLPLRGRADRSDRYGDVAIGGLLAAMHRLGARSRDMSAKLFGGAAVLPTGEASVTVGEKNLDVALDMLDQQGIPVVAQRTGGHRGLQIRFNSETGDVDVRRLGRSAALTEIAALAVPRIYRID